MQNKGMRIKKEAGALSQRLRGGNDIQVVLLRCFSPRVGQWWPGLSVKAVGMKKCAQI